MTEVVIVDAIRTPVGALGGALSAVRPDDLAAHVIKVILERNPFDPALVEEVFMGCANQAGEDNRNVARMALLLAGLPVEVGGVMFGKSYWCFDLEKAAAERPVSDIAAVQNLLRSNLVNTRGMFSGVRLLWLSEDKRSEMLVIYGEKTSYRNIDCSNRETAEPLLDEMSLQFLKDFNVIKFNN